MNSVNGLVWVNGLVVGVHELKVSVADRTFEHGLGLFETLRTWNFRAPLLDRHLARLKRSAHELGLPYDSVTPPDDRAVTELVEAQGLGGDVMLRITLTGGTSETYGATLWMRAAPLPPPMRHEGARVEFGTWEVDFDNGMSRYKSLNYWGRRRAYESGREFGFDEVLSASKKQLDAVWEGSRTNVFAVKGEKLVTPSVKGPIVPGIMRGLVLERAKDLPLEVPDVPVLLLSNLFRADEVFLTNSVRGVIPVGRVSTSKGSHDWRVPGHWTTQISMLVSDWLKSRGNPT